MQPSIFKLIGVLSFFEVARGRFTQPDSIQLGVQALLRDRLYDMYYKYHERGYAPWYAKENFENLYKQYHSLGENGVMDDYRTKFMRLPDKPLAP